MGFKTKGPVYSQSLINVQVPFQRHMLKCHQ
jgi:hypothetical protein